MTESSFSQLLRTDRTDDNWKLRAGSLKPEPLGSKIRGVRRNLRRRRVPLNRSGGEG